ncbi:MAG: hypothetical protein WBM14_06510 [Terracidiphilus sp.]
MTKKTAPAPFLPEDEPETKPKTGLAALQTQHPLIAAWDRGKRLEAPDYSEMGVREVLDHLATVYANALVSMAEILNLDPVTARKSAGNLWRTELPELTDRHSVVIYIACVAWGQRLGILDPAEVKTMIFMAQTQLSVLKSPVPPGRPAVAQKITAEGDLFPRPAQSSMEAKP